MAQEQEELTSQEQEYQPRYEEEVVEEEQEEEGGDVEEIEGNTNTPRFSAIESIFLVAFNAIGDLLEILDLTGVGVFIGMLVDAVNGPGTVLYLFLKGVPRTLGKNAIAQGAELIPFLDILPIRTTAIIITIISTNHPQLFDKLGTAGEVLKKIGKK